jgi:hypothetical protein
LIASGASAEYFFRVGAFRAREHLLPAHTIGAVRYPSNGYIRLARGNALSGRRSTALGQHRGPPPPPSSPTPTGPATDTRIVDIIFRRYRWTLDMLTLASVTCKHVPPVNAGLHRFLFLFPPWVLVLSSRISFLLVRKGHLAHVCNYEHFVGVCITKHRCRKVCCVIHYVHVQFLHCQL